MQALYDASLTGCVSTLNTLIRLDPLILHQISLTGYTSTPLHISASIGHLEFSQTIVNCKPQLAAELDSCKRTPLHLASAEGHAEIVKVLLQASTHECMVYDHCGKIPLHYAAARGRDEVVVALIRAEPKSVRMAVMGGGTVFHLCVQHNRLECLKLLVESLTFTSGNRDYLNSRDPNGGNTILELAFSLRHMEIFRYLLSIPMVNKERVAEKMMGCARMDILENSASIDIQNQNNSEIMFMGKRELPSKPANQSHPAKGDEGKLAITKSGKRLRGYKGDWLHDAQGTLMLVATVISTISFQAATNPPGGLLQDNKTGPFTGFNCTELDTNYGCHAGTAVLAYTGRNLLLDLPTGQAELDLYKWFTFANTVSFISSLSVMFLILSGVPLKNYFCTWLLSIIMCVTLTALAVAYLIVIISITPNATAPHTSHSWVLEISVAIWIAIILLVGVVHTIRLLFWLGKKICHLLIILLVGVVQTIRLLLWLGTKICHLLKCCGKKAFQRFEEGSTMQ